jgi:hypothetical protein
VGHRGHPTQAGRAADPTGARPARENHAHHTALASVVGGPTRS